MLQPNPEELKEMYTIGRQYSHFLAYLMRVRSQEYETAVKAGGEQTAIAQGRARMADDLVTLFRRILEQK